MPAQNNESRTYTVGSLTREIKSLLEDRYPFLWITGEVSNYVTPASGHSYFSLKDASAVISCVMFKNQKRRLTFRPENGMKITGMARISLYEPRGSYQLIFEHMEPEGAGSLQQAFEALKKKLSDLGWFDSARKKPLPFLPGKISVITSGTGAAVRDIIHVATRRYPGCRLEIVPVKVQGESAEGEIGAAIQMVNGMNTSEVIILARGGGSIEDLWAFNTETIARAIYESEIPVVTGVGHEIDFTIADFVADLRAPTPSAAAEMVLPDQRALLHQVNRLNAALDTAMEKRIRLLKDRLRELSGRLKSPARVVDDFRFRIEDAENRLHTAMNRKLSRDRERLFWLRRTLENTLPLPRIREKVKQVTDLKTALDMAMVRCTDTGAGRLKELTGRLEALNPAAILDRGYSITRELGTDRVITDADTVTTEDRLEIILAKGKLVTRVETPE